MKLLLLILSILNLCSCQNLSLIKPVDNYLTKKYYEKCTKVFPEGRWQFTHSIKAKFPNRKTAFLIGITVIDSNLKTIECVMMTIEGFVVFNAHFDGKLNINRAVPPFNSPNFANGIIRDIKFIFLNKENKFVEIGSSLETADCICRYQMLDNNIQEIVIKKNNLWEINEYNKNNKLIRSVKAVTQNNLLFRFYGILGYELEMNLIEGVKL